MQTKYSFQEEKSRKAYLFVLLVKKEFCGSISGRRPFNSSELFSGAVSSTRISCLRSYAWMLSDIWKAEGVYQFFACFESCRTSLELAGCM